MNILAREKGTVQSSNQTQQQQQQPLAPECVDTKLIVWENDQFEQFQVDFLNQVYPEKINKDTMAKGTQFIFHFLSKSLYHWVELKEIPIAQNQNQQQLENNDKSNNEKLQQKEQKQKLGLKDVKFIQSLLSQQGCDNATNYNRWGKRFMKKQQFLTKEANEDKFNIPKGEHIKSYTRNQEQYFIVRYFGDNKQFIPYKQRFQILFLFYIDGVSFVDEENQQWEYFAIYKKKKIEEQTAQQQKFDYVFVGVLSKYIFKLTAVKERHRISQVFIMPAYQKQGHGKQLLDLVYQRCLDLENCFEITTEIPSFQYQCLRDYKQLELILTKQLVDISKLPAIHSKQDIEIAQQDYLLTKQQLRKLKEQVKLPGNQIQRLIHLLIYAKIQSQPQNQMSLAYFEQFTRQRIIFNRSAFKSRKKVPHITFQGQTPDMKQFFLQKAKQDYVRNQQQIQEILSETLDGYRRVITKLTKNNLIKFI